MRNNKGISLIVLVITIIVMIILATAIILSLNSSGIIEKANNAVSRSDIKAMEEELSIKLAEAMLDGTVDAIEGKPAEDVLESAKKYPGRFIIFEQKLLECSPASWFNTDGNGTITGIIDKEIDKIVIPAEINGVAITAIGDNALESIAPTGYPTLIEINTTNIKTLGIASLLCNDAMVKAYLPNVTTIGDSSFCDCMELIELYMPKVETIGAHAFDCCSSLEEINLPVTLKEIGEYAFYGCYNLKTINYAGTKAQWNAVQKADNWCEGVQVICSDGVIVEGEPSVVIGDIRYTYVKELGGYSISPAKQKAKYNDIVSDINGIPVVSVADEAFLMNEIIEEIVLPDSVTIIGKQSFLVSTLKSIKGKNVTTIGKNAFVETSIENFDMPNIITVGDGAFSEATLTNISLPNAVTIGDSALAGYGISSISLPNVTVIGASAFNGCPLTSVSIPKVTTIGDNAFLSTGIGELDLPVTLTSIGSMIFENESNITINYAGTKAQWNAIQKDEYYNKYCIFTINCSDGQIIDDASYKGN